MPSALADSSEGYGRIDARGMRQALDACLAKREGKSKEARTANGSHDRGVRNTVKKADSILLAEELLRRFKLERQREQARERQQRRRQRMSQQKA